MAVSTTATPSKPNDTPDNSSVTKPKNDEPGSVLEEFDNRKTCHQCRQRTLNSVAHCKNHRLDQKFSKSKSSQKPCPNKFCTKCLLNRYGEKVEEVEILADWKCPKCRDICNCSFCRKRNGHMPTGCLVQTAKKTGFSSVSDMLIAKGPENFRYNRVAKNEQTLITPKKCGKENSVVGNGEVEQKHPLTSEGDDVKKDGKEKQDGGLKLDNSSASVLEEINLKPKKKEKKIKSKEDVFILENKRRKKSHLSKDSTPSESKKDESANAKNDGLLEKMDSKNSKETLETNEMNGHVNQGKEDGGLKLGVKGNTISCILENIDSKPPKKGKRPKKSDDGAVLEKKRRKKSQIPKDTAQKSGVQEDMLKDTRDSMTSLLPDLNEAPVDEIICNGQAKLKSSPVVEKAHKNAKKICKEVSEIPIILPQGIDLKVIVGIDLLDDDVGPVIQFLEFCKAFGEISESFQQRKFNIPSSSELHIQLPLQTGRTAFLLFWQGRCGL